MNKEQPPLAGFGLEPLLDWDVKIQPGILQSTIQKAVRRGRSDLAIRAAASMWAHSSQSRIKLVRRVPVIVLEDAVLTPNYDELIDVMIRASRVNYAEEKKDLAVVLRTVAMCAESEWCDEGGWDKSSLPRLAEEDVENVVNLELSNKEAALVRAMQLRGKFGGMPDDIKRQNQMAAVWVMRFLEMGSDAWEMIERAHPNSLGIVWSQEVVPLTHGDLEKFPYGLDSHCTGVLKVLFKKPEVRSLVRDYEHLDWIVWNHESGVNLKKTLQTAEPHVDPEVTDRDPMIWAEIMVEYHNLQDWWLAKKV